MEIINTEITNMEIINTEITNMEIINNVRGGKKRRRDDKPADKPTLRPAFTPKDKPNDTPNKRPKMILLFRRPLFNNGENEDGGDPTIPALPALEVPPLDECPNPLCDHDENTQHDLQIPYLEQISSIDDIIALGRTYHCKINTEYNGIDLKVLCKLILPLTELQSMVGMSSVKEFICNQILFFVQKTLNSKPACGKCSKCVFDLECENANTPDDMMHTVITGPPGVGKTELGKILGKVYVALGILKKGHFTLVSRGDLVGKYLGHTAIKTQDVINKCRGGVMFIDEAYSLGHERKDDLFSKECIDTLNQNLSEHRDFLCIIAGYKDQLNKCFFSVNKGLQRRFTFTYDITPYTAEELLKIFIIKLQSKNWFFEETDAEQIVELFQQMSFPNQGGDMETLFFLCRVAHCKRAPFLDPGYHKILTYEDISEGLDKFVVGRSRTKKQSVPIYSHYE